MENSHVKGVLLISGWQLLKFVILIGVDVKVIGEKCLGISY
jgi:hypothetical protein